MIFLTWNNKKDAEDSLAAVNAMYGCPYVATNGYKMDRWDSLVKSYVDEVYGFYKPEERLGMRMPDLMPNLIPGYVENDRKPTEFYPPDEDEKETE